MRKCITKLETRLERYFEMMFEVYDDKASFNVCNVA